MHTKTVDIYDVTVIAAFLHSMEPSSPPGLGGIFLGAKKEAGSEVSTAHFSFIETLWFYSYLLGPFHRCLSFS